MPGRSRRPLLAPLLLAAALTVLAACSSATPPAPATATAAQSPSLPEAPLTPAGDIPVAGHAPVAGTPWYLAIGDSVTFGFSLDPARAGVNSSWALQLQGLLAASGRPWQLYDT